MRLLARVTVIDVDISVKIALVRSGLLSSLLRGHARTGDLLLPAKTLVTGYYST